MAHNQRDNSSFRPNNSETGNHWRRVSKRRSCRDLTRSGEPEEGVGNAPGNDPTLVVNDQMSPRQNNDSYFRSDNYGFGTMPDVARIGQGRVENIVQIAASDSAEARGQRTEEHLTRENGSFREQLLNTKRELQTLEKLNERIKAFRDRMKSGCTETKEPTAPKSA